MAAQIGPLEPHPARCLGSLGLGLRLVARLAQALLIAPRVRSAPSQRLDMVDLIGAYTETFCETGPAEGLFGDDCGSSLLPSPSTHTSLLDRRHRVPGLPLHLPHAAEARRLLCHDA